MPLRKDRTRNGGGTLIYIADTTAFKPRYDLEEDFFLAHLDRNSLDMLYKLTICCVLIMVFIFFTILCLKQTKEG